MTVMQSLRARRSRRYAAGLRDELERADFLPGEQDFSTLLKPSWVLHAANGLITTEIGFVTMTVLPNYACHQGAMTIVPGCDNAGNRGFLVFLASRVPFHSLAGSSCDAGAEATAAYKRADSLVAQFGSREALKAAADAAPWYRLCRIDDAYRAGLCCWGVDAFLGRFLVRTLGTAFGMPRIALRIAGSYGDRISAATQLRHQGHWFESGDTDDRVTDPQKSSVRNARQFGMNGLWS